MKMIVEKKNGSIQSGEYTITNLGEKGVLSGGKSSLFQRLNDLTVPVGLGMMNNHVTDRINRHHTKHIHEKPIDGKMFENLIDLNRKDKPRKRDKDGGSTKKSRTKKNGPSKKASNRKKGTKKHKR